MLINFIAISIAITFLALFFFRSYKSNTPKEIGNNVGIILGFKVSLLAGFMEKVMLVFFVFCLISLFYSSFIFAKELIYISKNNEPSRIFTIPCTFIVDDETVSITDKNTQEFSGYEFMLAKGQMQIKSIGAFIFSSINAAIHVVFLLIIFYLLYRIFYPLARKEPFTFENVNRIRMLGLVYIIYEILHSVVEFSGNNYVHSKYVIGKIHNVYAYNISTDSILLGLSLFIIAEIIRCGAELKVDADLTV